MANTRGQLAGERADLLDTLAKHRYFPRYTVRGLTGEQNADGWMAAFRMRGGHAGRAP